MKIKDRCLLLFFLCWAFLYSPLVALSVFPLEQDEAVLPEHACAGHEGARCKIHAHKVEQENDSRLSFFNKYEQFMYGIK